MKYKCGDKVVIIGTITHSEDEFGNLGIDLPNGDFIRHALKTNEVTHLEDLKPAEKKIKMTVEEKKEFDRLYPDTWKDVLDFLDKIHDCSDDYPNLNKRLFAGDITNIFHSQIEFVKALEKPSRIEVEKEKKYKIKILNGYLYNLSRNSYRIIDIINYGDNFTQSEIDKLQKQEQFKAIDLNKCKEEVKNE